MRNVNSDEDYIKKIFSNIKTIVIKIGASIIATAGDHLDKQQVSKLVDQIVKILHRKINVILVSSGAIASGMGIIGLKNRPTNLPRQQACAAIGQSQLMNIYSQFFGIHNYHVGQVLLTRDDMNNRQRYLNAKNTLLTLLELGVVPIINENDTVSTDEIKFGDNDRLSGLVATLIGADLLILLSDVDGLYSRNNKLDVVKDITSDVECLARPTSKATSVGGMVTKLDTAKIVTACGIPMVIANGKKYDILAEILAGKNAGTLFLPKLYRMDSKKHWIAFISKVKGYITVDDGAKDALVKGSKSLLTCGIAGVKGKFDIGDTVIVSTLSGHEFAKGITNYSAEELNKIKGLNTSQIQKVLGYKYYDEVIHTDNLAIL